MTRVLVAGPPAAGKTTYAQDIAARLGAEVIDLDLIANGLGSPGHDHPKRIREAADREVERRIDATAGPVVVVRSVPESDARRQLAERMRADRVVVLAAPADVARQRAVSDGRPSWTGEVIDRWWSRYSPGPADEVLTPTPSGEWADHRSNSMANDDTNASTQDGNESGGSTSDAGDKFDPITSQEDFDERIQDRIRRVEAKFADYDDLRKRAAKLDEIEAGQMSEAEKALRRAEEAEKARDEAVASALRLKVAADHGISTADAELFLTGADEETLTAQAQRLADREALARNRTGAVSPNEGRHASPPPETLDDQFAEWAEAQLTR